MYVYVADYMSVFCIDIVRLRMNLYLTDYSSMAITVYTGL